MKAMKKLAYILAVSLSATMLFSCSNLDSMLDTENKSEFDASVVFSNYTLAEYNVFSISETFGHTNNYRGRFLPWYGFNTDAEWFNDGTSSSDKAHIGSYSVLTNNSQLNLDNGPYNEMYAAIERANLCINGLRTYGNVENDKEMAYLLGEALTLRAMIYYDLVKAWGDVPARFEPITSETIYIPKSSRDVIFKQILADLEESFNYLPWPATSAQTMTTDRVSKAFAKGLYARIALVASGYALRPEDGMVGTGDIGTVRTSNDPDLQKSVLYPKAYAAVKDVIENSGLSLYKNYEQLWRDQNTYDLAAGKEAIFVIPFSNDRGRWNFTNAINDEDLGRGGDIGPVPTLYFEFEADDVRRDITCVNWSWKKGHLAEPAGINKWYFGKFRFEWMNVQLKNGFNDDGVKPMVLRYSDILLMAAELANAAETSGTLAEAKGYLKEVRTRAYGGDESKAAAYVNDIANENDMFEKIMLERKLEFAGEYLRKGDLIRWNKLGTTLAAEKAKMTQLANRDGKYSYLSGNIYWRANENGVEIWGLNDGETAAPEGDGWQEWTDSKGNPSLYISESALKPEKIESLYETEPDTRQFWPIFQNTITNSQKSLVNDYGY